MLYWHYRHAVEFSKNTRTPSHNTNVLLGGTSSLPSLSQAVLEGFHRAVVDRWSLSPFRECRASVADPVRGVNPGVSPARSDQIRSLSINLERFWLLPPSPPGSCVPFRPAGLATWRKLPSSRSRVKSAGQRPADRQEASSRAAHRPRGRSQSVKLCCPSATSSTSSGLNGAVPDTVNRS
jgi:hypothetical protein